MKIHYHRCPRPNFGDELNLWFWPRVLGDVFDPQSTHLLVGIGTVLNDRLPEADRYWVIGAGAGYGKLPRIDESWRIWAVRGPLTARRLGLPDQIAITDPAMFMPRIYPAPLQTEKGGTGFMPHVGIDSPRYRRLVERAGLRYISPSEPPLDAVRQIASLERLITSAMHGAIIADAYGVPWHPLITSKEILPFKWQDWTLSMELEYQPTRLPALWPQSPQGIAGRVKDRIKQRLLAAALQHISARGRFYLSNRDLVQSRLDRLETLFFEVRRAMDASE